MSESVLRDVAPPAPGALPLDSAVLRTSPFELDVRLVAEAGRAFLLAFALFVVNTTDHPFTVRAAIGIAVAAGIWQWSLARAASSARVVLGRAGSVALGAGSGLAIVGALNQTAAGLHAPLVMLLASTAAVFASAYLWQEAVALTSAGRSRVLLVGTGDLDLRDEDERFEILGAVPGSAELGGILESERPDVVVLLDESSYDQALDQLLDARAKVQVATGPCFYEHEFGRIPPSSISSRWFLGLFHPRQRLYAGVTKRAFDVLLASIVLALAAPAVVVCAALARLSTGAAFYRQTRVGEGGRRFTICKFATMRADAEADGVAFSCADDPRATRIGGLLRRTHLDELPQLWNVLRGDMSIVGPRPERPEFVDMIEAAVPFWNRRLLVKPGITGWAQIRCEYASDCRAMEEKLSYDLWYLRHRSLFVDMAVCARTFALELGELLRFGRRPQGRRDP